MECDCKIGGETGRHILLPCQAHREWMEANVRAERERCAKTVESFSGLCAETIRRVWDDQTKFALRDDPWRFIHLIMMSTKLKTTQEKAKSKQ